MASFAIRPVRVAEYERLGEITVAAFKTDGYLLPDDPYEARLRNVAYRAAHADVLVAAESDRLLGGVALAFAGSPMTDLAEPGEAEIRMLAVAHEGRGRGVGTALTRDCLDRARAVGGVKRVVLASLEEMESAHRIYERFGFVRVPERDWSPVPELSPLWVYTLDL